MHFSSYKILIFRTDTAYELSSSWNQPEKLSHLDNMQKLCMLDKVNINSRSFECLAETCAWTVLEKVKRIIFYYDQVQTAG